MKICPSCRAHYEAHVPACLADGSALVPIPLPSPPPPAPPPTPLHVPILLPLISGMFLAIGGITGLVLLLLALPGEAAPRHAPDPAPPTTQAALPPTEPIAEPEQPEPEPDEPAEPDEARVILLASIPDGAEVREHGALLCHTPCALEHPSYAPLPRTFELSSPDHPTVTHQVDDPGRLQLVQLQPEASPEARQRALDALPRHSVASSLDHPRPQIALER